ncbi:hypothetical protein M2389_001588 [Microbacterium phyllosphaerae]|nr:hypothetical protein [Microbacterium phyllosphaerae]
MHDKAVLHAVARASLGLERAGSTLPDAAMAEYLASVRRIAGPELAGVLDNSAQAAVPCVLLLGLGLRLRSVARQVSSGEKFGASK